MSMRRMMTYGSRKSAGPRHLKVVRMPERPMDPVWVLGFVLFLTALLMALLSAACG